MTRTTSTPAITAVRLSGAGRDELPLLVLGPSLGTSAMTLWSECAAHLTDVFDVLAWDLPGHGHNTGVGDDDFTIEDLARGVLSVVDDVLAGRGEAGRSFAYAGVSVGGAVGLQLLVDHPRRVGSAVLLCTGAKIGEPAGWQERIDRVTAAGTAAMVTGSAERWFAPGFLDRDRATGATGSALLHALQATADTGYARVCDALAGFDLRDRLDEIASPTLLVAGAHDAVTTPDLMASVAHAIVGADLVVLDDVAHLAPAEAPAEVAALIRRHVLGEEPPAPPSERYEAGMVVRREVLGAAYVDRATAGATDLTRDFQQLITEYAWGSIWTRPGLDRRSRSLITLTALVARGHHEELELHLRAALRNGLTIDEIKECLMQTAIYCGVPDANTAFRIARRVLEEEQQ